VFAVGQVDLNESSRDRGPPHLLSGDTVAVDLSFNTSAAYRRRLRYRGLRMLGLYGMLRASWKIATEGQPGAVLFDKFYTWAGGAPVQAGETGEGRAAVTSGPKWELNRRLVAELARWNESGRAKVCVVEKRPIDPAYLALLGRAHIPVLFTTPVLDSLRAQGINPYEWAATHTTGHWNADAHAAIARAIAPALARMLPARGAR